jgi:cytidine deaminase
MAPRDLIETALNAQKQSYAPYSHFAVGAALRDERNRIHAGCNIENAAFPEGMCAEAAALAAMVVAGGRRCIEIALVGAGDRLISPCGGCRQKLREFGTADMAVHLCDGAGKPRRTLLLGELLPCSFGPEHLA